MGAARTPAYKREYKNGPGRIIVAHFTEVDDTDYWVSGIDDICSEPMFATAWIGDPGTQAAGGGHVEHSAGTVTFHPSTDNLGCNLTIYL